MRQVLVSNLSRQSLIHTFSARTFKNALRLFQYLPCVSWQEPPLLPFASVWLLLSFKCPNEVWPQNIQISFKKAVKCPNECDSFCINIFILKMKNEGQRRVDNSMFNYGMTFQMVKWFTSLFLLDHPNLPLSLLLSWNPFNRSVKKHHHEM